jgi:hypothetical protein
MKDVMIRLKASSIEAGFAALWARLPLKPRRKKRRSRKALRQGQR